MADVTAVAVGCADDVGRLMRAAERRRTVQATDMNARSSRSHTLMQLRLHGARGRQVCGAVCAARGEGWRRRVWRGIDEGAPAGAGGGEGAAPSPSL